MLLPQLRSEVKSEVVKSFAAASTSPWSLRVLEPLVDLGSTSLPSLPVVCDKVPTTSVSVRTRSWDPGILQKAAKKGGGMTHFHGIYWEGGALEDLGREHTTHTGLKRRWLPRVMIPFIKFGSGSDATGIFLKVVLRLAHCSRFG